MKAPVHGRKGNNMPSDKFIRRFNFRIYPAAAQEQQMTVTRDACRFVWNTLLTYRSLQHRQCGRSVSKADCDRYITTLRAVFPWLKAADSMALQETSKDLDTAFRNFFDGRAGYPNYKSAKWQVYKYSFRTRNQSGGIAVSGRYIRLPKLGHVKFRQSRDISGRILNATLIHKPSGRWFVSLCVEQDLLSALQPNAGGTVGIDVGIKSFCADSNGTITDNPHCLNRMARKLRREQRRLSRRRKSSRGYERQRLRVAGIHERISDVRNDFLHKLSAWYAEWNAVIGIEDLNIKGMMQNHHLAGAIADASWNKFYTMLEYKAFLHGGRVIRVPRFYASSQACHICGHRYPKTKDLSVREWTCPVCGTHHDRDVNAAMNIKQKALSMLAASA